MDFVHLHNHTDYSILDGAITVSRLIERTKELGMNAVAITDHGNMFGAVEFYQKAKAAGIKPIVGQEFYMAPGSRFQKEFVKDNNDEKNYHLVLLAENEEGYKNLLRLSSAGYTEGFYYKPRIDMEILEKHSKGLICSSACLAGEIPRYILKGQLDAALDIAGRLSEIFGRERFYLELQDHGIPEQKTVNNALIGIARKNDIPLIASNDAHYVERGDAYAHEILLCVQTGKTIRDEKRMRFASDEFYLKTREEMAAIFGDYPDALLSTVKISEMTDLHIPLGNPVLPHFEVPDGYNLDSYLKHLVEEGALRIYGGKIPTNVRERIDYEVSVIASMGFSGYFLIVWDFINEAKRMNIPTGPGRGSAAGSIVSYCLGITALDPLKYDLLFERFLNPERNEMPDMDLDFCAERREEVIDYVRKKYGEDRVSQIITFNKMMAKAVVKDVARVLDIPFARANEISKLIDDKSLETSIIKSKELQAIKKSEGGEKELLDISLKLEGLVRSAGKHAAGVVISKGLLTEYVPLYSDPKGGGVSSQYEKATLEEAGLVKMDLLGLNNLTTIDKCLKLIKEKHGSVPDLANIPLNDKKVFSLLQKADTVGIFQLESDGMQNLLRRLAPNIFEDIIALVALYRPGPLKSGMADDFVIRKRRPRLVKYPHPKLEPVLKDTLGVIVYQEQVMLISRIIGGFTMPEADKLRKAMGKKLSDVMTEMKEKFIKGAAAQNIDTAMARELYEQMEKFGEYGFNKSHSAAYALITYQTAWLKTHYCIEYMTALLSTEPAKAPYLLNDCKSHGISVLPPSINNSFYNFMIEDGKIRFGFGAIKGLGEKAVENIISVREDGGFVSLKDFFERIDTTALNRGCVESLIKAGAFDELEDDRARLIGAIEFLMDEGRRSKADRESGQGSLFDAPKTQDIPDFPKCNGTELLEYEKEVLGYYISGHPLEKYERELRHYCPINEIADNLSVSGIVSIAGLVRDFAVKVSKNGNNYATGRLEDMSGMIELLIFGKKLEEFESVFRSSGPVLVNGKVDFEDSEDKSAPGKLIVQSARRLTDVRRESISAIHIKLDHIDVDEDLLDSMKSAFLKYRGSCPVYFHLNKTTVKTSSAFYINPSEALVHDLALILGEDSIRCSIVQSAFD
ncbi:MAG: DNA polymerase III subunit alpha [Leptospirales bacterium]|nr:DNA polymerase III subunit alpha [Leptospirales bacterium]